MGEIMNMNMDKLKALLIFAALLTIGMVMITATDGYFVMSVWVGGIIGGLLWGKALFQKDMEGVKRDEHERISRLMNDDMENLEDYGQEIPASANYSRTRKPF